MDAFDSDVLIYAATLQHPLRQPIRTLFVEAQAEGRPAGVGSVLLLPELLAKPTRLGASREFEALGSLLARLELYDVDQGVADLSVTLAAEYKLKAADAVHLATAVLAGADRFITNNSKDFGKEITEIEVTFPADL